MNKIHTIPVPQGWSPEQAWEAIQRGDDLPLLPGPTGSSWAIVETNDQDKFVRFVEEEEE